MIKYMPKLDSMLWSLKSIEYFNSADELKQCIADQRTMFYRFIGVKNRIIHPRDIIIERIADRDVITGWENCHSIAINGKVVGIYGE